MRLLFVLFLLSGAFYSNAQIYRGIRELDPYVEQISKLINDIRIKTLSNDCEQLLINIKIHAAKTDLFFEDKLIKYSNQ